MSTQIAKYKNAFILDKILGKCIELHFLAFFLKIAFFTKKIIGLQFTLASDLSGLTSLHSSLRSEAGFMSLKLERVNSLVVLCSDKAEFKLISINLHGTINKHARIAK